MGLVSCKQTENHTPPATGVFQEIERLGDNDHLESDERVAIANSSLRLEFDKSTGDWVSRNVDGLAESLVALNEPGSAIDFRVAQERMIGEHGTKLRETSTRSDQTDGSLPLQVRHGLHTCEPTLLIPRQLSQCDGHERDDRG